MICFPNAKINIGLNIVEKRLDGFHTIESVFYPIELSDVLEIVESNELMIEQTGIVIPGKMDDNICLKAYHLIKRDYVVPPIKIHLHKVIPVGAGLGGGSSDAAFFIKLLNDKFQLGISWGEMHNYARQLGSDCSFFVTNQPAYIEGKGDEYEHIALDLTQYKLVLVYPNIHVSTAEAYSTVTPKKSIHSLEENILKQPIENWKQTIQNDFENALFPRYPQLKSIKDSLYSQGALYASMSGSGSSVYGIFDKDLLLETEFKGCFLWSNKL